MYLLPYYFTESAIPSTSTVLPISLMHLLTVGGENLWEEDDRLRIVEDILEPNGLYLSAPPYRVPFLNETVYACRIDTARTSIDDFYRWKEIPRSDRETFCWRTFYRGGLPWFPAEERMGPFSMKDVYLSIVEQPKHVA